MLKKYISTLRTIDQSHKNQEIYQELGALDNKLNEAKQLKSLCKNEITKTEDFLSDFVKGFFKLELINRLYNTIDPHPEYKKVSFKCDYSLKAPPRLKVLLSSTERGKESIVPNLYFSTTQINIPSFCIFLAKALCAKDDKGKDMNCIFIDGPIQALDDINILSMIDQLRNVAFSMNKQIVLTTHDRNFFELLQKKMPDTLFNSRFITLPERGEFMYV